ncbi:hypothetical protein THIOKS11320094 [Thiocapsa sp. KS1]|nr:hypothetical protein THIOKS11320094 [Thiocapsa sp. KS1]
MRRMSRLPVPTARAISGVLLVTIERGLSGIGHVRFQLVRAQVDERDAITVQLCDELHATDAGQRGRHTGGQSLHFVKLHGHRHFGFFRERFGRALQGIRQTGWDFNTNLHGGGSWWLYRGGSKL